MSGRVVRVGVDADGYRERRNITGLPFRSVEHVRVHGALAPLAWLHYVVRRRPAFGLQHRYVELLRPRVDLLHFFFSISYGKTPWFVTTSSWIPRSGKLDRSGLERLAAPACRGLIAMSRHAWDVQRSVLRHNADLLPAIEAKATVLHPAQEPLVGAWEEKPAPTDGLVDCVFVGKQFFLKGGDTLLRVAGRLIDRGAPLRLHVVSSLEHRDFTTGATEADVAAARAEMARRDGRIVFHGRLPNADVLALLRRARVALLPTIADTYGYVVLEAQAAGCAVISTDVQALAEINSDACGWLVRVPRNELGRALRRDAPERAAFAAALESGLEAALDDALARPDEVRRRGTAALARIRAEHDPHAAAARLETLYAEALR